MNPHGAEAEDEALRYLLGHGLKLKERNYTCRLGEIDLILCGRPPTAHCLDGQLRHPAIVGPLPCTECARLAQTPVPTRGWTEDCAGPPTPEDGSVPSGG